MNTSTHKSEGVSLITGCLLMILTMVLHPVGGDFEHLLRIATVGTIAHVIAIISIPLVAYGFWGIAKHLSAFRYSYLSFSFMTFGLVAVMLAAAVNGLILMDFVKSYADADQQTIDALKPIFRLIRSLNHAFDFIFIGAVCISTFLWSLAILTVDKATRALGWLGILLALAALVSLVAGFVLIDLHGFRLFIFGWVAWVIWCGYYLVRST